VAGVKGRSGGSNRIPPEVHQVRGTYRRDRHAATPVRLVPLATRREWVGQALELDALGFRLARQALKGKPLDTKKLGAAIKTLAAADRIWARVDRAGGVNETPTKTKDTLEEHLERRRSSLEAYAALRQDRPSSLDDYRRRGPRVSSEGDEASRDSDA